MTNVAGYGWAVAGIMALIVSFWNYQSGNIKQSNHNELIGILCFIVSAICFK